MSFRATALNKRTVSFDLDVLLMEKARSKFSRDGAEVSISEFLSAAIESAVSDVRESRAIMGQVEERMRENAERRVANRKKFQERPGYAANYARDVRLDESAVPAYARKIIRKLREEGIAI